MSEHTPRPVPLDDIVARVARLDADDGFGARVRDRLDDRHAARDQAGVRAWLVSLGAAAVTAAVSLFVWSPWQQPIAPPTDAAQHGAVDTTDQKSGASASSSHVAGKPPSDTSTQAPSSTSQASSRQSGQQAVAASMAAASVSSGATGERQLPGAEAWAALQPVPIDVAPIEVAALENHRLEVDAIHVALIEVEPLRRHVPIGDTRSPLSPP